MSVKLLDAVTTDTDGEAFTSSGVRTVTVEGTLDGTIAIQVRHDGASEWRTARYEVDGTPIAITDKTATPILIHMGQGLNIRATLTGSTSSDVTVYLH